MSEDIAMLRGTVAALETQLAALRAACTAAEAVSARATAETLSLQSELEKVPPWHINIMHQKGCSAKTAVMSCMACAGRCAKRESWTDAQHSSSMIAHCAIVRACAGQE